MSNFGSPIAAYVNTITVTTTPATINFSGTAVSFMFKNYSGSYDVYVKFDGGNPMKVTAGTYEQLPTNFIQAKSITLYTSVSGATASFEIVCGVM